MKRWRKKNLIDELPIYDQPLNSEIGGDFEEEEELALMSKKAFLRPKLDTEDWLRTNIF